VHCTHQCVGCVRAFWAAHAVPSSGRTPILGWCSMRLVARFIMVRHVQPPRKLWSDHKFFSFPSLFSLFDLEKTRRVLCFSFITFSLHYFNCIKFDSFVFQFHPLTFDFYIKFILLFYDISGLTLNILIFNFDS
jgi:hypothetical protein